MTPEHKQFSRSFEEHLVPAIDHLMACRPFSVSMNNAYKYIMWHVKKLPNNISDGHVSLIEHFDFFFYIYVTELHGIFYLFLTGQRKVRNPFEQLHLRPDTHGM